MIVTSDRRPGSVGTYQAVKGIAPEQGACGRLASPFEPHYRAYGLFASSSGCQSRLSLGALAPLGRFLFTTDRTAPWRDLPHGYIDLRRSADSSHRQL